MPKTSIPYELGFVGMLALPIVDAVLNRYLQYEQHKTKAPTLKKLLRKLLYAGTGAAAGGAIGLAAEKEIINLMKLVLTHKYIAELTGKED